MSEVMTGGRIPYPKHTNASLQMALVDGYRMPPPPGSDAVSFKIMNSCWADNPDDRPTFSDLKAVVDSKYGLSE